MNGIDGVAWDQSGIRGMRERRRETYFVNCELSFNVERMEKVATENERVDGGVLRFFFFGEDGVQ